MACDACKDLCLNFEIDSAFSLRNALQVVNDNLADDTLKLLAKVGDLDVDKPSDRLGGEFACTRCGEKFRLIARRDDEVSGSWRLIADVEKSKRAEAAARRERIANFPKPGTVKAVTQASLRARLKRQGLDRWADELLAFAAPCLQLEPRPCASSELKPGLSRIGGEPYLPADFDWPSFKGAALDFLCQINLAELSGDSPAELPRRGLLSFFYSIGENTWGDDAADRGSAAVHYWGGELGELTRAEGAGEDGEPGCHGLKFVPGITLPGAFDPDPTFVRLLEKFEEDEGDRYFEFAQTVVVDHLLLGHPHLLQDDDLRKLCAEHAQSRRRGRKAAQSWRMLLQLGGDTHPLGLPWDGEGRLCFWIEEKDLAARRFDDCWATFQAT